MIFFIKCTISISLIIIFLNYIIVRTYFFGKEMMIKENENLYVHIYIYF